MRPQIQRVAVSPYAQRPWLRHATARAALDYEPGLLPDMLARTARALPTRPAVFEGDAELTFRELHDRVLAVADGLSARGVRRGDRVALVSPNTASMLIAYHAILRAGAVAVMCDARLTDPELRGRLRDAGAIFVFAATPLAGRVRALKDTPVRTVVSTPIKHGETDPEDPTSWERLLESRAKRQS